MSELSERIEKRPRPASFVRTIGRSLGKAALPMAAVLAMPGVAVAKYQSTAALRQNISTRAQTGQPLEACEGNLSLPGKILTWPIVVSRSNPDAFISSTANFASGRYAFDGTIPTEPNPIVADVHYLEPGMRLNMTSECVELTFVKTDGHIDLSKTIVSPLNPYDFATGGGAPGPDLEGLTGPFAYEQPFAG